MLKQLIPFIFIFLFTKCQTLQSLGINCKQGCKDVHVVMNGSLYWNEETLVDEQKEFLQLEFHNSNPKQLMNLKLELIETIYNNESLFELYPAQINNLTTQKISITFKCYEDIIQQFQLKVELINTINQTLVIPFKKQCNNTYFDSTKDLIIENSSFEWDNNDPQLLQNISAVFEFVPPNNQTLYIQDVQLNIDNNNTKSAKELIKNCQLDPPLTNVSNSKNLSFTLKLQARTFLMKKVNPLLNIVLFNLQIISLKFKDPFIIYFYKQCDKKDKDLENNQEFPIYIGTKKNTNELFRGGVSQLDYNYTTKSIHENTNAFEMFIYFKTKDKQIIQDRLYPNGKNIDIEILTRVQDQEILKIKHQKKIQMNNIDDRKQILLYFECQQQGIIFIQQILCQNYIKIRKNIIWREIVYYIICIIAMLCGVQTIRVFTNLIKQDTNGSEITIDTTYKQGYDNIEEEKQIEL